MTKLGLQKWKSDPLYTKYAPVKEWIIQCGSEEKKLFYLEAINRFISYADNNPADLAKEATLAEGLAIDDKLKGFAKYLENQGVDKDRVIEYYLAVRSFYIWNGFLNKVRAVPREFKRLVAVNAYDWDNPKTL